MQRRLYRSHADRIVSGVCGGLAEYLDIDPTIVRLVFVALTLLTSGVWAIVYIVMAILVPLAPAEGEEPPVVSTSEDFAAGARSFGDDVAAAARRMTAPGVHVGPKSGPAPAAAGGAAAGAGGSAADVDESGGGASAADESSGGAGAADASGADASGAAGTPEEAEAPTTEGEAPRPSGEPPVAATVPATVPAAAPAAAPVTARQTRHEERAERRAERRERGPGTGGLVVGAVLVLVGLLLLVERFTGIGFWWLFSLGWQVVLPALIIAFGVLMILRALRKD